MRKVYSFIFLLFLFSCYSYRIPNEVIKAIEIEDDNLCMMEGVEFKYEDTRLTYWECRLRIIDQRIDSEFDNYGYGQLYKGEFKKLRKIIKNRINEQKAIMLNEIRASIEEKEHNFCVLYNEQYNGDPEYDYFKCRKELESLRDGKDNFANFNNEYVIKIFESTDEIDTNKNDNVIFVNKECIRYVSDANKFKTCQDKISDLNQCFDQINNKMTQRNIDDKIYCTKLSLTKYPDSLVKFDAKTSQDAFLGPKMNKLDVVELREQTYRTCYKERLQKAPEYRDFLEDQCKLEHLKNIK